MKNVIIILVVVLVAAAALYFGFLAPKGEQGPFKSTYVPGEYFITNIKDSKALLKVTIVLEVDKAEDDDEFHDFLKDNNHVIRDTIVFILRSKTETELRGTDIRLALENEIIAAINQRLGIDNIKAVYFNDYVLQ